MFLEQFGELSVVHSQRLVGSRLLYASVFHHDDHVDFWQDCQRVGREHTSLKTHEKLRCIKQKL